jgi:hypothetical protein
VTDDGSRVVLERLRAIDWSDAAAYEHANSRALLMREFLRRTAAWAKAYDGEASWPFLDLVQLVAPEVEIAPDTAAELERSSRVWPGRDEAEGFTYRAECRSGA